MSGRLHFCKPHLKLHPTVMFLYFSFKMESYFNMAEKNRAFLNSDVVSLHRCLRSKVHVVIWRDSVFRAMTTNKVFTLQQRTKMHEALLQHTRRVKCPPF